MFDGAFMIPYLGLQYQITIPGTHTLVMVSAKGTVKVHVPTDNAVEDSAVTGSGVCY